MALPTREVHEPSEVLFTGQPVDLRPGEHPALLEEHQEDQSLGILLAGIGKGALPLGGDNAVKRRQYLWRNILKLCERMRGVNVLTEGDNHLRAGEAVTVGRSSWEMASALRSCFSAPFRSPRCREKMAFLASF